MKFSIGRVFVRSFLVLSIPFMVFASGERILIFKDSLAYNGHQAAIAACLSLIRGWANDSGFSVDTTIHLTDFNTANLANYNAAIALYPYRQDPSNSNTWYDDTMSGPEDSAFKSFLLSGKGYLSVHCGSRLDNNWPWFLDSVIGVQYTADQGPVSCTFHVAGTTQMMTKGIPPTFTGNQQVRGDNIFFSDTDKSYTLLILSDSNDYVKENVPRQKFYPYVFMHDFHGAHIWEGDMGHASTTWTGSTEDTIWGKLLLRGILYVINRPGYGKTTVPTLVAPSNNASNVSTSPTFSWNTVSGATSYSMQLSTTSSFSFTFATQIGLTAVSANMTGLALNTRYYWEVNASNAVGTSAWSGIWSFSTVSTAVLPQQRSPVSKGISISNSAIIYELPIASRVSVVLYDIQGRLVRQLLNTMQNAGSYNIEFKRAKVTAGYYIVEFKAGTFVAQQRLVLMK